MAMSRSFGCTLFTTRLPIEMVPEVMFSSPASIRNSVDLPQPDGPTSTTKAPSSIGTVTPCRTSNPPNDFRTSLICTDAIHFPPNCVRRNRAVAPPLLKLCSVLTEFFRHVLGSKSNSIAAESIANASTSCKKSAQRIQLLQCSIDQPAVGETMNK